MGRRNYRVGLIGLLGFAVLPWVTALGQNSPIGSNSPVFTQAAAVGEAVTCQGVVTWVDAGRGLAVVQEGKRPRAFWMDPLQSVFSPGVAVELAGRKRSLVTVLPDFPHRPASVQIIPTFETLTNWNNYFVARGRAYLHPPVTGNYTFWIASDDSSELWLSDDATVEARRKIAFVAPAKFTQPRAWDSYRSQKSRPMWLEAGKRYYLEALQQDNGGVNHLAVAWQIPGQERAIIAGHYLAPWGDAEENGGQHSAGGPAHGGGVRWECWTNFSAPDLGVLAVTNEFIANLSDARVVRRSAGAWPEPLRVSFDRVMLPEENFQFVEVTGRLSFCSQPIDRRVELELMEGAARINVQVTGVTATELAFPEQTVLRVQGVWEGMRGADGQLRPSVLWTCGASNIAWVDAEENWSQHQPVPAHGLVATNAALRPGQLLRLRGVVSGPAGAGRWQIQADDVFRGYTSPDGTNWTEVGAPVQLTLSHSILAGFAIVSHHTTNPAVAEFAVTHGPGGVWRGAQIGSSPVAGNYAYSNATLRIEGGGWNIWNMADQCYYVYGQLDGDGQIVARVKNLTTPDWLGKAAIMMRAGLDSSATWAGMIRMPNGRSGFQARREPGGRVAGNILPNPADWMRLTRQRSSFLIQPRQPTILREGELLDILGWLTWKNGSVLLTDAVLREMTNGVVAATAAPKPPLTRVGTDEIEDVRIENLVAADERAELEARPVRFRIRGVVTYIDRAAADGLFFIQDDSGGCLIRLWSRVPRLEFEVGQSVELIGNVAVRGLMPEFTAQGCAMVGRGSLPVPLRYPFEAAQKKRRKGQWHELQGVGREVSDEAVLTLVTREGNVGVKLAKEFLPALKSCVNSLVRIRGVYWDQGKPTLLVASPRFIEIIEAAPEDPFALPVFPIGSVLKQEFEPWSVRRLKIEGVVTSQREEHVTVQDVTGGISVELDASLELKVGDGVEVVGFLSKRAAGVCLTGALVRSRGPGTLPPALGLVAESGLDRNKNALLVKIEATLLQTIVQGGTQILDLQTGQRAFRAFLPLKDGRLSEVVNGSKVRVTGVSQIEDLDGAAGAEATAAQPLVAKLELLLRAPGDLVVLQRPPWWNWKHTATLLGVSVLGAITSVIWIRTLRRRVEERTQALQETMGRLQRETQTSATLAERERLAGEIHDSVEQGLSAIIMQMDTAAKLVHRPDEVSRYLTLARNMAGFSRSEVQHAVWGLQSPLLENADLPTALRRIAQDISAGGTLRVTVEVTGEVRSLPRGIEHHLLRAAQEAVNNAVKHAQPETIQIVLTYQTDRIGLRVRDDGCGFDPQAVSVGMRSFGLKGLHMRTKKMHGSLNILSQPGAGTSIEMVVPLTKPQSNRTTLSNHH